jgi:uncharacterized PurR-regulated membrane protein YhhQ (DUF165 family)
MTRLKLEGGLYIAGFIASISVANWMIGNVGTFCISEGSCMIPVAPGLTAPSAVLMVGLALILRDLVQRRLGKTWAIVAIFAGAFVSYFVAPSAIVIASVAAFLLSELADYAVYTPLQERRLITAVVVSSLVGLIIDSMVFLYLAFGSLDYLGGQIVGKAWMVLLAIPVIWWIRNRDKSLDIQPA